MTAQSMAGSPSSSSQLAKPSIKGWIGSGDAGASGSGGPGGRPGELQLPQVQVVGVAYIVALEEMHVNWGPYDPAVQAGLPLVGIRALASC